MDTFKRNLIVGLAGMALLLLSVLIYAQVNASHNYDLSDFQSESESSR